MATEVTGKARTYIGPLSHFNEKLLFSGLPCSLFVAGYRKIFFARFIRERVIEVERSG
jgi:hypothetical protein